jgi:tetratricopeptide (TPR) repeat protein
MSRIRLFPSLVVPILLVASAGVARGQNPHPSLADRLSSLSYAEALAEARAHPQELRDARAMAWYVLLLARDEEMAASLALADSMMAADRSSVWAWYARTAALGYYHGADSSQAALAASDTMYGRAPQDPDVLWLRAATLSNNGRAKDVIVLVDSFLARHPSATHFIVLKANATWSLAGQAKPPSRGMRDTAEALWAKARTMDSSDVRAWNWAGTFLLNVGRTDEACALLRRAAELAPLSTEVNADYWRALRALHMRDRDQARVETLPGIQRILAARGHDPEVLGTIADEYQALSLPDSQRVVEERLLSGYPASSAAEGVLVSRFQAVGEKLRDTTVHDSTLKGTYRRMLEEFVSRPTHQFENMLGLAYTELFDQADSTMDPDTLLNIIRQMQRYASFNVYVTYSRAAITLADRNIHLDEAERIAREGAVEGRKLVQRDSATLQSMDRYAETRDGMNATMADALGWVLYREGKRGDAELQLRAALDLSPRDMSVLYHIGRMFEAAGAGDSAEAYYIRGAMLPSMGKSPNREALQKLYLNRHGSAEGYDAYYASIRDRDRARRRADVTAELKATRDTVPAFTLVSVGGDTVRSTSLAGHVAIINFWGTWCSPCVMEMPEMQRFWRQVAPDTAVRVVTVSNDADLAALKDWLQRHQYDMPVLVDAGYAGRAGVQAYPTTWFLDRSGRIAFIKVGWSEELAEEFGWRVDILKTEAAQP